MRHALSFDDVLLVPNKCSVNSRKDVDLSTDLAGISLKLPIISANMPTISEEHMCHAMATSGGLGVVHRMCSMEDQARMVYFVSRDYLPVGAAIGIGADYFERARACMEAGASLLCVDVAHGHQDRVLDVAKSLLSHFRNMKLIIGNIATAHACSYFQSGLESYLDRVILKVGVGGGSACTTRIATGCGLPTFQSVLDVASVAKVPFIADGGIRTSGDIVKCLAAGASAVMVGSLLSGTDETPGEAIRLPGQALGKVYRGAASYGEKKQFFGEAEYIEGAETVVPLKGKTSGVLKRLSEGVASGLTYCGARNLLELRSYSEFVTVTAAGAAESHPHGVL